MPDAQREKRGVKDRNSRRSRTFPEGADEHSKERGLRSEWA